MKNYLVFFLLTFYGNISGQIPNVNKSFSINSTIDYFIDVQSGIKQDQTVVIISLFYYEKEKYFMIDFSTDYVKLQYDKKPENFYANYKYKNFDILLVKQNLEQINFLKRIIKDLKPSIKSSLEFIGKPKVAISNDPYSWCLDFDDQMNLRDVYITEDVTTDNYLLKIKKIEMLNNQKVN